MLGTPAGLRRFVETQPSAYHGLNFCQGTVAEMLEKPGEEIYDVIRDFGRRGKIFNVHFRNIRGCRLKFEETFPDNGDVGMPRALRVYREVGNDGMIMPDHVPQILGDPQGQKAFAFCFGYIQALLQTLRAEDAPRSGARLSGSGSGCRCWAELTTLRLRATACLPQRPVVRPVVAAGALLSSTGARSMPAFSPASPSSPAPRRRYAIVGLGSRHELYQDGVEKVHAPQAELVAVCDPNPGRIELARQRSIRNGAVVPAGYRAAEFDRMLRECRPDVVIVTSVDATHHDYIIRAMEAGCDVITEKPMTIDAEKCRRILETRERTGRRCRVTFNYRYSPPRSQVKELLMSGVIGDVLSVDFHWLLNTHHGADYFRRWHAEKKHSGGLFVHKSTHHFDLVNWWLGAVPVTVLAAGKREFYTPEMARRMGLSGPHERCRTCPESARCGFYLNLEATPGLKTLYADHEEHDQYWRDRCVFRPEIDIEDTLNAMVTYDTGATLSYSLNAFNAWEGYTVAFNGTRGRLEHSIVESVYVNGTETVQGGVLENGVKIRVVPLRGEGYDVEPWSAAGDHGGGDRLMLEDIFLPTPNPDKYLRAADERAGACSILVGIAANRSLTTGARVAVSDLIGKVPQPDYPPMPTRRDPVPMPVREG